MTSDQPTPDDRDASTPGHVAVQPRWVILVPPVAALFVVLEHLGIVSLHDVVAQLVAVPVLMATIFCAVHHAEVIAHKVGEPMGSLVLAIAVTVIEVALIISIMLASPESGSEIARNTVFAAMMIVLTGIIGACLLVGGIRFYEQGFQARGAIGAISVLATLATLTLILPNYTLAVPGPFYSNGQLIGVGMASLALYFLFLFVQSIRHRAHFLDSDGDSEAAEGHGLVVTRRMVTVSLGLLVVSLVAVVMIAEGLSPAVEGAITAAGLPLSFVGVVIAALILLPESIAALRAARQNRIQQSLNLAVGSALASIGLTIPTIAFASVILGIPLSLGLEDEHTTLLILAVFISTVTASTGRSTILQGGVHLVIFAAFLIISAVP
ncbi:calcium:proton antiporter [Acuticoccus sp. I52.16.1]|uniref:calcium:proton antiporter n=1 Tax=Acuticoccus sp. I52.16.1 TaxID=2928472 RepID=UPI001FD29D69|nr:ionic transporter y4hA [Acuticoccus sp. I52.16.1]UOM32567.1 ionic transporter y4hA [Acuticoccus sp. I52.16.1]